MKNHKLVFCAIILVTLGTSALPALSQAHSESGLRAGFSLGYLSRTLDVGEEAGETTPELTSVLASLVLRYDLQPGFSLAAHVGYSSSAFDGLAFRRLPFSVDFGRDAGRIGGLLLGAEIEKSLLGEGAFGLGILGRFFASLGIQKEWDLPGLAAEGSVKGKPVWMKASVGPVLSYRGWAGFTPFLFPRFDYLWGTFELDQKVQSLEGNEKKDIKGKGQFGLGLGADFELSKSLRVRGEAGVYPRGGGADYSFLLQTIIAF
ncbi:MAG: hypothetical protein H6P98_3030 [Candidatus Aminicenantes bacterium]|nr:hypothetical protein [Candidatus Aminicenantes bacterium]